MKLGAVLQIDANAETRIYQVTFQIFLLWWRDPWAHFFCQNSKQIGGIFEKNDGIRDNGRSSFEMCFVSFSINAARARPCKKTCVCCETAPHRVLKASWWTTNLALSLYPCDTIVEFGAYSFYVISSFLFFYFALQAVKEWRHGKLCRVF